MSSKKQFVPFHPWETMEASGCEKKYTRMGVTQVRSEAFLALLPSAVSVYLQMKIEAGGKPIFKMPHRVYTRFISNSAFQNALKDLETKGFVEIIEKNKNRRKPNVYRFSTAWREWKPPINNL